MRLRSRTTAVSAAALAGVLAVSTVAPAAAGEGARAASSSSKHATGDKYGLRVATYNASLNRGEQGQLLRDLSTPDDQQARNIAQVIQINDPDIVLLNEFDYVPGGRAAQAFRDNYLAVSQNGHAPVDYPYHYVAPVNTGVPSGLDLNQDGTVGGPDDAWGFGLFPGQYGMVIYSKYPIARDRVRTFQHFRWQDMPGNHLPTDYYTPEQAAQLRLSSKSHWDVPVRVGHRTVHVLAAHPTPPSFDGPEDRNGRRNNDEIRFWSDYVTGNRTARYIYDDAGRHGGLPRGERFVIVGDYNSDPNDGDSFPGAARQLLDNSRLRDPQPTSKGAVVASARQGGANRTHVTRPALDTADFSDDPAPGNLRVDYALPSKNLPLLDAGVFWPAPGRPGSELTGEYPFPTSDHRLVWVDIKVPGRR
ncbi:endonuclease/exonuclease/phosphatase family protein [Kocuria indica]|uniref:Endonuclease/exonuclease/phosphatase family protein n=1 Tax=Kocuria marina subsp. indica TaxID=1049583 RepID=A0A6N9QV44_9MICC|nr:endonuclease/exonuclease/phosphatase family protein [Kocuria indica]NDO77066.1 endonuclease/exonuclease/phosphatase family protein [Kocuria indica]